MEDDRHVLANYARPDLADLLEISEQGKLINVSIEQKNTIKSHLHAMLDLIRQKHNSNQIRSIIVKVQTAPKPTSGYVMAIGRTSKGGSFESCYTREKGYYAVWNYFEDCLLDSLTKVHQMYCSHPTNQRKKTLFFRYNWAGILDVFNNSSMSDVILFGTD